MRGVVKQSLAELFGNKLNVLILCLLTFLTSFMYFFVEASIDTNIKNLSSRSKLSSNEHEFLVGLSSNRILAIAFLFGLTVITCFVFYMFYKKLFNLNRKELGCYRALGFTKSGITIIFITFTFGLVLLFLLLGLVVGYYYSYILLETYHSSYGIDNIKRGISIASVTIGVVFPLLFACLMPILASRIFRKPEVAMLMSGAKGRRKRRKTFKTISNVCNLLPSKYAFSTRVALRNPFNIFLVLLSVYLYMTLIVLSFSLNMSSSNVLESQKALRHYKYEVIFPKESLELNNQNQQLFFLKNKVTLDFKSKKLQQTLIAMDNGDYFALTDGKKKIALKEKGIVINQRIAQLYNLKKGDKIKINLGNSSKELTVKAVANNGDYNTIYIKRSYFNKIVYKNQNVYNGMWSDTLPSTLKGATVNKYSDYVRELEKNNVSNKLSAVINQILACVFGVLIIFLALLLNFQDNTENFKYLLKLGYLPKEIHNMLINIYFPIISAGFLSMILPSIFTSTKILNLLSLQTGDYMPFSTNIFIFSYSFIFLSILYFIILVFFNLQLKRSLKNRDDG